MWPFTHASPAPTVYDPAVLAQAAHAMQVFGAQPGPATVAQVQALTSTLGEAAAVVVAMSIHSSVAEKRGFILTSDPNVQQTLHMLHVTALDPQIMDIALHNTRPEPAMPIAERLLDVVRKVMAVTAGSGYHVTPEAALVPLEAMPLQPTHVVLDK